MSCRYKNECPSYSGWCEGPKRDFSQCVQFLISAYENEQAKWNELKTDENLLLRRFRHLLESDIIAGYDEVDPRTGKYKKDIKEFDKYFQKVTSHMIVNHECYECGFKGEVTERDRKLTCPKCGTINDVWLRGENPPKNHKNKQHPPSEKS